MKDVEEIVYKNALVNAVKHKGKANNGAVMGSIMASHAELRSEAKKIGPILGKVVAKVNAMDHELQKTELEKLGGMKKPEKKEEPKGLPDLPDVEGKVTLRFAPNPSGPLHIGHARAAILNSEYVKRYGGKLILRIEDTDPRRVDPEAYQSIGEDLKWLGFKWDEEYIQSDRMETYYHYAEELIKLGQAYMCTCNGSDFKKLKDESRACPCRDQSVEKNMELWRNFNKAEEGDAVLRVKTDINHKNPAIRDWVAMRIVDEEHPRTGNKYRIYPMMNFSVAVDDHLMGVTHVLRGKDHLANSEKQKYLYKHFGWKVPVFIHYGRLKMEDVALSTSKARAGIEEGRYTSWDDPRLGTIRAIARRGIKQGALQELITEIGPKMSDATVSWKKIYGLNRSILEDSSDRYFFVGKPVKVQIANLPEEEEGTIEIHLHPNFPERGNRELPFNGKVYLTMDDVERAGKKGILRLMDAVNIRFKEGSCGCGERIAVYQSSTLEDARSVSARIVHWVPIVKSIVADVVMPDAKIVSGFIEPAASKLEVGDVVQLERFGFARVDSVGDRIRFYFAHK